MRSISNFDEINIRTYEKSESKTGVYFLSIEGGKKLSCFVSKRLSGLPYRFSKMRRTENQFSSFNFHYKDSLDLKFHASQHSCVKSELDKWLTERYALFQDCEDSIMSYDIHHKEWLLSEIDVTELRVQYPRFNNMLSNYPDKIQFSEGVKVVAWGRNN